MNSNQLEGKWKQLKGSVKEKWGKLTDDDLDVIAGKHDQLLGKMRKGTGSRRKRLRSRSGSGTWLRIATWTRFLVARLASPQPGAHYWGILPTSVGGTFA